MSWLSKLFGPSQREEDLAAIAQKALDKVEELEKQLADREPRATEVVDEYGQLAVSDWNAAYAASKRALLPPDLTKNLTDAEVVNLWVERRNIENEEPRLEMVHSDIMPDGQVAIKLDWNDAFIRLLQARGIEGKDEEELIQNYLHVVSNRADSELFEEETADIPLVPPTEDDIEAILDKTDPETLRQIEKSVRRRAAQRGQRQRSLDKS